MPGNNPDPELGLRRENSLLRGMRREEQAQTLVKLAVGQPLGRERSEQGRQQDSYPNGGLQCAHRMGAHFLGRLGCSGCHITCAQVMVTVKVLTCKGWR